MNQYFSRNLREFRLGKNMTQEQVAEKLDVSAQSVSRWECGNTVPDILLLPKIASLYEVTIDDLFREKSVAYDNYAQRLTAVYERTRRIEDFMLAEKEYKKLLKGKDYTINDLRSYGCICQWVMQDYRNKADTLFRRAMSMRRDEFQYYRTKQQYIGFRASVGKINQCIEEQKELVLQDEANVHEWNCLIMAYCSAKDYDSAYKTFLQCEPRFSDNAELYCWGGDICRELKDYEHAFLYWEKSLELDDTFADCLYSMGFCWEELGDYEKAYKVWQQVLRYLERKGFEEELFFVKERLETCRHGKHDSE